MYDVPKERMSEWEEKLKRKDRSRKRSNGETYGRVAQGHAKTLRQVLKVTLKSQANKQAENRFA